MGVMVMVAVRVPRSCRCRGSASYGTHAPADESADGRTMPTPGDSADYGPGAGAEETAPERSVAWIVGVCGGCCCR